jgi:hypothetical protein
MKQAAASCASCGRGLLHELVTFEARSPEGRWCICASCCRDLLVRLDLANSEAGELLEALWEPGA